MSKKPRKPRNDRAQQIAKVEQELAKLKAKEAGTYVDDSVGKQVKKALTATRRELKAANTILDGAWNSDGSIFRKPIAAIIERTKERLANQIASQKQSNEYLVKLPFDIEKLEALSVALDNGENVEFPGDLEVVSGKSDTESEKAVLSEE